MFLSRKKTRSIFGRREELLSGSLPGRAQKPAVALETLKKAIKDLDCFYFSIPSVAYGSHAPGEREREKRKLIHLHLPIFQAGRRETQRKDKRQRPTASATLYSGEKWVSRIPARMSVCVSLARPMYQGNF